MSAPVTRPAPDVSDMTVDEYRWARVLAAVEAAYPGVAPKAGEFLPSEFVAAFEARHPWVRR